MLASLGCFFAHLSYSLRTACLASSFFMLATRTSSRCGEGPDDRHPLDKVLHPRQASGPRQPNYPSSGKDVLRELGPSRIYKSCR